jgi:hypothetical protein
MDSVSSLNNQQLQLAIAMEIAGYRGLHTDASGKLMGYPPTAIAEMPLTIPDWPNDSVAIFRLERRIKLANLQNEYLRELSDRCVRNNFATPRIKSEAALLAFRSAKVAA